MKSKGPKALKFQLCLDINFFIIFKWSDLVRKVQIKLSYVKKMSIVFTIKDHNPALK